MDIKNLKSKLDSKKSKIVAVATGLATPVIFATNAFAAEAGEGTNTVITALDSGMSSIKDDCLTAIATIAPYAIGVFGAYFVWVIGKKIFKTISK